MQLELKDHLKSYIIFPFFLINMLSPFVLKLSFLYFVIYNLLTCAVATVTFITFNDIGKSFLHKIVAVLYNLSIMSLVLGISGDYVSSFRPVSELMIAVIPFFFIAFILSQALMIKRY